MKIYLLRHGETDWNREGRAQGRQDIPMNENGLAQVRRTAEEFRSRNVPVQAILSSPLLRARTAAEIVAEAIGYPAEHIVIWPELTERSFGEAEGSTPQQRQEKYPDGQYPGMESAQALCSRAAGVLKRCLEEYKGQTVLLAAHGMILKAVMAEAVGADFEGGSVPIVGPASLNLLEYTDGRFRLEVSDTRDPWFR